MPLSLVMRAKNGIKYLVHGTRTLLDISLSGGAGFAEQLGVIGQTLHQGGILIGALYLKRTSLSNQVLYLTEVLIVGPDDYRYAIDGSLRHIVDTHSESAADISDLPIAVYRREQTIAVYDQTVRLLGLLCRGLSEA